ncbi:hypothetical protein CKAH01_02992 [Colletotrichum kahawae]|uniref:Uncharacterized protein n=1 Tax=Colletotrichum kahawae TaxID=34407 RepID=A0AAE0DE40_COLKA|nr:hypothetical protein CKAH01_02992 [Colletotrichum kahawae]
MAVRELEAFEDTPLDASLGDAVSSPGLIMQMGILAEGDSRKSDAQSSYSVFRLPNRSEQISAGKSQQYHPLSVKAAANISLLAMLVINISNYQKFDDQRILFRVQDGSTRNKATFREARAGPGIGPPRLSPAAGGWIRSRMSRRFARPQQYQERDSPSPDGKLPDGFTLPFRIIDRLAKPSARSSVSLGSDGTAALRMESGISDDQEMMPTIVFRMPIKPSAILGRFRGGLPLFQSVDQQRDLKAVSLAGLRSSTLPGNTQLIIANLPDHTDTQSWASKLEQPALPEAHHEAPQPNHIKCFRRSDHDRLAFLHFSVHVGAVAEADVRT